MWTKSLYIHLNLLYVDAPLGLVPAHFVLHKAGDIHCELEGERGGMLKLLWRASSCKVPRWAISRWWDTPSLIWGRSVWNSSTGTTSQHRKGTTTVKLSENKLFFLPIFRNTNINQGSYISKVFKWQHPKVAKCLSLRVRNNNVYFFNIDWFIEHMCINDKPNQNNKNSPLY